MRDAVETVHVIISGRVQGVWYRGWTCEQARALGLNGWVRNRRDGTVEAIFSGAPAAVAEMLAACRRGPPAARVIDVTVQPDDNPGIQGFEARPTV
jgi:acylphosphatase